VPYALISGIWTCDITVPAVLKIPGTYVPGLGVQKHKRPGQQVVHDKLSPVTFWSHCPAAVDLRVDPPETLAAPEMPKRPERVRRRRLPSTRRETWATWETRHGQEPSSLGSFHPNGDRSAIQSTPSTFRFGTFSFSGQGSHPPLLIWGPSVSFFGRGFVSVLVTHRRSVGSRDDLRDVFKNGECSSPISPLLSIRSTFESSPLALPPATEPTTPPQQQCSSSAFLPPC